MRRALLATTFMLCAAPLAAQAPAPASAMTRETKLASAALRSDLATLRAVYDSLHPGLYRYNTPAALAARFDSVDRYFASDRTLGEAFVALTRLTASLKCGHSYPNFWNQRNAVAGALFEGQDKVPFEFRWIGRRMVVTGDRTVGALLPRGTEVLAIDGTAASRILDTLLPLARADGNNDAKRVAYLEVQGNPRYHAFDVLHALVFPRRDTLVTLRVRRPGTRADTTVVVPALTAAARRTPAAGAVSGDAKTAAALWSYREADGIGIMHMPSWSLFDDRAGAKRWVDSVMTDMTARGVPHLVVDLRGNEGGIDAGNHILEHLVDAPVTLPPLPRYVRYRAIPAGMRPVLDTWDRSFDDWSKYIKPAADPRYQGRFFRMTRWDDDTSGTDVIRPVGPRYRGRVWALVDASNSSATFVFASALMKSGLATMVGQPTGGNRRGINGSAFYFVRLPGTGLEVDLPLVAQFPPGEEPDAGIVPQILVVPTVEQVARGEDAEMAAVRARIRGGR